MRAFLVSAALVSILFFSSGCGEVTYPKEKLAESVAKLCKKEYGIDTDVSLAGETLVIYLPLTNLFNLTLNLSENAQDKIQDVLLSASRVVLSTDADIKFYCIIAQDVRLPEIQLVIIKYTDDVKRAFFRDISRGEYFKRSLIDINENPQAKKEKAITDVFAKMKLDKEWQEKVLDDFFRSPPSSLEGIGYWNGKFYIKDIAFPEFLAEQMASRIRLRFREKENLTKYGLRSVTGKFAEKKSLGLFLVSFNAEVLLFIANPEEKKAMEEEIFANVFEEISNVIYGYKFKSFNFSEMTEISSNTKLMTSKEDVYLFKRKKLPIEAIVGGL
ncbi:MAG: hypothetical protein WBC74_02700 [Candidatus Omnitrophota bacterium]